MAVAARKLTYADLFGPRWICLRRVEGRTFRSAVQPRFALDVEALFAATR